MACSSNMNTHKQVNLYYSLALFANYATGANVQLESPVEKCIYLPGIDRFALLDGREVVNLYRLAVCSLFIICYSTILTCHIRPTGLRKSSYLQKN